MASHFMQLVEFHRELSSLARDFGLNSVPWHRDRKERTRACAVNRSVAGKPPWSVRGWPKANANAARHSCRSAASQQCERCKAPPCFFLRPKVIYKDHIRIRYDELRGRVLLFWTCRCP